MGASLDKVSQSAGHIRELLKCILSYFLTTSLTRIVTWNLQRLLDDETDSNKSVQMSKVHSDW